MQKNSDRLNYLYQRYTSKLCTPQELREWFVYATDPAYRDQLAALADEEWSPERPLSPETANVDWEYMFQRIIGQAQQTAPVHRLSARRLPFWRMAAAAVIVLALGFGTYFFISRKAQPSLAGQLAKPYGNDIGPGGDKAILTLADGRRIMLDSASGRVAKEGGVTVINLAGRLSYEEGPGLKADGSTQTYHTVSTPRGGQYQLVLEDGTKVWLNAASSLRFPTAFTGKERKVEVTGEAYFEVAKKSQKVKGIPPGAGQNVPFLVASNGLVTEVLGTHFNVNAYTDESDIQVTLLEGSVKVSNSRGSEIIKPGEQAVATINNKPQTRNSVDLEKVMAWKNGLFSFRGDDIHTIMRQIARWYDVEVVYEKPVKEKFHVEISRNTNVSNVFKILESTGGVHFKIEGRKIVVMP